MKEPLVSILIPNYNKAPYLRETLDSVLAQTFVNWECIVVDDHSTDNSWEILKEYALKDSRFKIYKRPENRLPGGNAARNFGFEMSKGEFINWFDSDDLFHKEKIDKQVKTIVSEGADLVISRLENLNNQLPYKKIIFENDSRKRPIKYLEGSFWFQTSVPLFKKEFLLSLDNLFREDLKRHQEGEFFTRILLTKPKISFLDYISVYRRFDENSIASRFKKLKVKEKMNINFFAFELILESFKLKSFFGKEEKQFFVDRKISYIQYAEISKFEKLNSLLFVLKYGSWEKKWICLKSFFYNLFYG